MRLGCLLNGGCRTGILTLAKEICLLSPVLHDRSGADQVRADISAAGREQQAAIERIERVENGLANNASEAGRISEGLGSVAESIAGVEKRIDSSQGKLTDSAGLIAEGQRILGQVRARCQSRE